MLWVDRVSLHEISSSWKDPKSLCFFPIISELILIKLLRLFWASPLSYESCSWSKRSKPLNKRMIWKGWKLFSHQRKSSGHTIILTVCILPSLAVTAGLRSEEIIMLWRCCGSWRRKTESFTGRCFIFYWTKSKSSWTVAERRSQERDFFTGSLCSWSVSQVLNDKMY